MTDPVIPQDKMAAVVVITEKQDTLVYIIAHVVCTLFRIIFEV